MHCIANICYVCLERKNKPISNINSSLSANKDVIHILGYLPLKLFWLKSKRIILICEECCTRLREIYQFLTLCDKNSALLQRYTDHLNTSTTSDAENEAELTVTLDLNIKHKDINEGICEIKLDNEEMHRDECGPIFEDPGEVYVNLEDYFVKEEDIWKCEETDNEGEHLMDNHSTECIGNESKSEIFVNTNAHITNSEPIIAETEDVDVNFDNFLVNEDDTWNREEAGDKEEHPMDNHSTECTGNESKSEISVNTNAHITNSEPIIAETEEVDVNFENSLVNEEDTWNREEAGDKEEHPMDNTDSLTSEFTCNQVHATNTKELNATTEKSFTCATCSKSFITKRYLTQHVRIHTGEKPYECSRCEKCFYTKSFLIMHMRVHTGEKPYKCPECSKCFSRKWDLTPHMRVHTGEKPYECTTCKKCFNRQSNLACHMRIHSGVKPFACSMCTKRFVRKIGLINHVRVHTGERPYKCTRCAKCFKRPCVLASHMRLHTGEKPYKCSKCEECFCQRQALSRHNMRVHADEKV